LKVISGNINGFVVCLKNTTYLTCEVNYNVRASCEQLFYPCYSTRKTIMWCWARPVSDS